MVIIETPVFSKQIKALMDDDLYRELQEALIVRPDVGDLIKGSGGVRVIYYWYTSADQVYMLYAYTKSKQSDLTPDEVATLKLVTQRWLDGKENV